MEDRDHRGEKLVLEESARAKLGVPPHRRGHVEFLARELLQDVRSGTLPVVVTVRREADMSDGGAETLRNISTRGLLQQPACSGRGRPRSHLWCMNDNSRRWNHNMSLPAAPASP